MSWTGGSSRPTGTSNINRNATVNGNRPGGPPTTYPPLKSCPGVCVAERIADYCEAVLNQTSSGACKEGLRCCVSKDSYHSHMMMQQQQNNSSQPAAGSQQRPQYQKPQQQSTASALVAPPPPQQVCPSSIFSCRKMLRCLTTSIVSKQDQLHKIRGTNDAMEEGTAAQACHGVMDAGALASG
ncbi:hypothetical protein AAG570_003256 [Ranatra chinensis]|uniref:Protein masquerade clip-domain domain-containing protein n=1 Tax=Ranatra chinensis TaxID=642074 RepID=A0ABD0Y6V1_9HEMI